MCTINKEWAPVMAFRVVSIALGPRQAVLDVAIGDEAHRLAVTIGGAVLVPPELARHPLRGEIETEACQVAAAAWLGRKAVAASAAAGDV